jgi:hypothetical protein
MQTALLVVTVVESALKAREGTAAWNAFAVQQTENFYLFYGIANTLKLAHLSDF